ncbi:MAG TPA: hypothetical protein VK495_17585 [Steroidobacteraceae bacterium]|nr:hypothetical protein [Steroidobacteraceae bacterium]
MDAASADKALLLQLQCAFGDTPLRRTPSMFAISSWVITSSLKPICMRVMRFRPSAGSRRHYERAFNRQAPLDAQTYGGGGGYPFDPSLHQNGAIGRFFLVGANYKF